MKNQKWMRISQDIIFEWRQCMDDGLDVAMYENECEAIHTMDEDDPQKAILADDMYKNLHAASVRDGYSYLEPSDLEGIRSLCTNEPMGLPKMSDREIMLDKIHGAWLGRIAGCLLGKPVEGWHRTQLEGFLKDSGQYPLCDYMSIDVPDEIIDKYNAGKRSWCFINNLHDGAPSDDDTNYTVLALKLIEQHGRGFTPMNVMNMWLSNLPMLSTCTAERAAYRNMANSIFPPKSATHENPFREWIGAQIRGDFFGYINPGNPDLAAEYAWRDASVSHTKNGIYGEMFIAAMLAAAAVTDNMRKIIESGLARIPQKCRLAEKIREVMAWYDGDMTVEGAVNSVHTIYNEKDSHHWCHTISNAMIVVIGLLYGEKDFTKSICYAVSAAFDTDCNGATVGSIIGMILGAKSLPRQWIEPLKNKLATDIAGYNNVDIYELAVKTIELIDNEGGVGFIDDSAIPYTN